MRATGTLKRWEDDRGFGFIQPDAGGKDLFVHISAFPRHAPRPRVGDSLTYEPGFGRDSKEKAIRVIDDRYPNAPLRPSGRSGAYGGQRKSSMARTVFSLLLLVGGLGYVLLTDSLPGKEGLEKGRDEVMGLFSREEPEEWKYFRCDGRTHCSEMNSCSEAKFFLANCPGVKMDGDYDGVPCEGHLCPH